MNKSIVKRWLPFELAIAITMFATVVVQAQNVSRSVTKSFAEPLAKSTVAGSGTGVIQRIFVKEGDRVEAGQALAVIAHDVLLAQKEIAVVKSQSAAEVQAAKTKMQILKAQKDSLSNLYQSGHANKFEYEQKVTDYENALAEYEAARNRMELSTLEVKKIDAQIQERIIKSPIDGFVTEIHKQLGEHVSISEPQFATVVQVSRLKVRFFLAEEKLNQINVYDRIEIQVGIDKATKEAIVVFVSPTIDPESGTGRVELVFDNTDASTRSGTACFWGKRLADDTRSAHLQGLRR